MQPLFCDFETYYDTECSLSKLSTREYVHHPDFEVLMCAIADHTGHEFVIVGERKLAEYFATVDWDNTEFVAHNAVFDATVLREVFGYTPARYYCTMMASRPHLVPFARSMALGKLADHLNYPIRKGNFASAKARGKRLADFTPGELSEYIDYAGADTAICRKLYELTRVELDEDEQLLLHASVRKAVEPVLVANRGLLMMSLRAEVGRKKQLFANSGIDPETIMSNAKFAKLLRSLGVDPPMKVSPRTGKSTYAFAKTDTEFLKLQTHRNEQVRLAVECRLNGKSTIEETRLARFINLTAQSNLVPFPLLYYGAHTGRAGGYDKLNMQNLTKGSALRQALCAPVGHKLVVSDLSQIEARMVAWLAGVVIMLAAFRDPTRDVYCEFGTGLRIWGEVTRDTYESRFVSKMGVLSLMYGSGPPRFTEAVNTSGQAAIDLNTARTVVYGYRESYPEIPALWGRYDGALVAMLQGRSVTVGPVRFVGGKEALFAGAPHIQLPEGRRIYYPDLRIDSERQIVYTGNKGETKYLWGGTVLENISQALSQLVIRRAELSVIRKTNYKVWAAGQVHDELIYAVPESIVQPFSRLLTKIMVERPPWASALPLACETEVGDNYADAK